MNSITAIPTEIIPNEDFVYRNIHVMQSRKWVNYRRPNETDFSLKSGEEGLSVNWDKYCTLVGIFVLLGLQKLKDGINYRNPRDFKVMKFNVGEIRDIKLVNNEIVDIIHKPELNNKAHADYFQKRLASQTHAQIQVRISDHLNSQ